MSINYMDKSAKPKQANVLQKRALIPNDLIMEQEKQDENRDEGMDQKFGRQ